VNDYAGILRLDERVALENRATQLQQKTGAQLTVVILKSLEGGQIDDFANKLFSRWGVGQKGKNNGLMLLVALADRKARVEVGYGLEPILPDALAGRVLDQQLFPAFKRQQYGRGLQDAVSRIAQIIERGEPAAPKAEEGNGPAPGLAALVLFLALFVAAGFGVAGAAVAGRHIIQTLCGLFFGGVPLLIALGGAQRQFSPLLLFGLVSFVVGWFSVRSSGSPGSRRRYRPTSGSWGGSGFGNGGFSSGGFGGGGFGGGGFGGGGFGGFGGGSSGGGGASGGW
jgi:uncharacterized protein